MRVVITTLALVLTGAWAVAQQMVAALEAEYTVAGPRYGASLMYESGREWGAGIFYQDGVASSEEPSAKDQFYGASLQIPFVTSDRLSFFGALRGGLVENKFVVVVPGIETRINLGKRMAIAFGMSLRMSYPSVSSKLAFKIF